MSSHISTYVILLANLIIFIIGSPIVEFNAPDQITKNEPYKLIIRDPSPEVKFPTDNFAFSFELLKTVSPRVELSVADVSSFGYTGDEYRGFSIRNFVFKKDMIEMNIEFRAEAHGAIFRVRYISVKIESDKESFYISNTEIGLLMTRKIEMLLPYTITMQVGPEFREVSESDRDAVGQVLLPGKNGRISCQATDGLPNPLPTFENSYILPGVTVYPVNNYASKLIWMVSIRDHGKEIQCRAGQQIKNVTLYVYHYMSDVVTSPAISRKVEIGSQIKCLGKDGFPVPRVEWNFVSGPKDANKYYELRDNKTTLFVNYTAPINSNWTFECLGSNYMSPVVVKYLSTSPNYPIKRAYNFTVIGSTSSDIQSSSAGVIVVTILLLTITIAVVVVGIVHREKVMKFINSKRPGSGPLAKTTKKPIDSGYKYSSAAKGDPHRNGTEKDTDTTYYTEIVGTVQPKSNNPLGPIDRV